VQTVRDAIRAFNAHGLAALSAGSSRPKSAAPVLGRPEARGDWCRSTWTLALLARVAHEQGLSATVLSGETIRRALLRLGVGWKRAKRWLTSPDPAYVRKKVAATA
jgi:transposase